MYDSTCLKYPMVVKVLETEWTGGSRGLQGGGKGEFLLNRYSVSFARWRDSRWMVGMAVQQYGCHFMPLNCSLMNG